VSARPTPQRQRSSARFVGNVRDAPATLEACRNRAPSRREASARRASSRRKQRPHGRRVVARTTRSSVAR
jgi:hypothetical protein